MAVIIILLLKGGQPCGGTGDAEPAATEVAEVR
jgi:hypothetical protein